MNASNSDVNHPIGRQGSAFTPPPADTFPSQAGIRNPGRTSIIWELYMARDELTNRNGQDLQFIALG